MVWDRLKSAGKKAVGKAKEYDDKMVERHGDDSDALDQLTGDSRRGSMQSPDVALGLDDGDGGDRQVPDALGGGGDDGSPGMPDAMGNRSMDDSAPGVPDLLGENDRDDDRLW